MTACWQLHYLGLGRAKYPGSMTVGTAFNASTDDSATVQSAEMWPDYSLCTQQSIMQNTVVPKWAQGHLFQWLNDWTGKNWTCWSRSSQEAQSHYRQTVTAAPLLQHLHTGLKARQCSFQQVSQECSHCWVVFTEVAKINDHTKESLKLFLRGGSRMLIHSPHFILYDTNPPLTYYSVKVGDCGLANSHLDRFMVSVTHRR